MGGGSPEIWESAPLISRLLNVRFFLCIAIQSARPLKTNAYHFTADRSVHSDTNPTSLESIQPCYTHCAKTIYLHISTIDYTLALGKACTKALPPCHNKSLGS